AGVVDAQDCALVRAQPREEHEAGDADAEKAPVFALRPLRGLLGAARVVSRQTQRGVKAGAVVAAVVDHRDLRRCGPDVPGKLVSPDEVAPPYLDRVHPERLGQVIDGALEGEDRLGLAGAAIRRRGRLARERTPDTTGIVADPIGPG